MKISAVRMRLQKLCCLKAHSFLGEIECSESDSARSDFNISSL